MEFEKLAAEFLANTGKMAPGKDAPIPDIAASHLEWRLWRANKRLRDTLEMIADAAKDCIADNLSAGSFVRETERRARAALKHK